MSFPRLTGRRVATAAATAAAALALALVAPDPAGAQEARVFRDSGPDAASIQDTVDRFRNALGTLNANEVGSRGSGRREINWDGVPDDFADPTFLPGNFFNVPISGRARGAQFVTPGRGVLVSAVPGNPTGTPPEFGGRNPNNPAQFTPFSAPRLFSAVFGPGGGNTLDVSVRIPGRSRPAVSRGFGVVFTDVERANSTSIELFNRRDRPLIKVGARPARSAGLSFVGVVYDEPVVARVRIRSGNVRLGGSDAPGAGRDLVVMDDFIYGEPVNP
jgi:hypothetical protein